MAISLAAAVLFVRGLLTAACNRKYFLLEVGKMDEQGFKIKIQRPVGNSNQSREKLQNIFGLSDWLICAVNCTNYVTKFQARYYDDMINSSFCFSVFWQRAIILADTKIYSSYWCSGGSRCFTVSRSQCQISFSLANFLQAWLHRECDKKQSIRWQSRAYFLTHSIKLLVDPFQTLRRKNISGRSDDGCLEQHHSAFWFLQKKRCKKHDVYLSNYILKCFPADCLVTSAFLFSLLH